jgi:hypothetical protein
MEQRALCEYLGSLTRRYPSVSSVWLLGSRASGSERPESDWDLLVFADEGSFAAMQSDPDVRAAGVDLLVVSNGDRFEQPWREGAEMAKSGYLSTWEWTPRLGNRSDVLQYAPSEARARRKALASRLAKRR